MPISLPGPLISGISNAELAALAKLVREGISVKDAIAQLGLTKRIREEMAIRLLRSKYGIQLAGQATVGLSTLSAGFWIALTVGVLGGGAWLYYNWGKPSSVPVLAGNKRGPAIMQAERPRDSKALAIDVSGEWRMMWNWSVTTVYFVGTVTQSGPTSWTFDGTLESGGNAIWTPAKGSARANCTLVGDPDSKQAPAKMSCSATFAEGKPWQGESNGTIQAGVYNGQRKFDYKGRGKGTGSQGEEAGIDHLDLWPKTD